MPTFSDAQSIYPWTGFENYLLMTVGDLALQGDRTAIAIVLTKVLKSIPVSTPEGLTYSLKKKVPDHGPWPAKFESVRQAFLLCHTQILARLSFGLASFKSYFEDWTYTYVMNKRPNLGIIWCSNISFGAQVYFQLLCFSGSHWCCGI